MGRRRSSKDPPKLDLCKIDTARLRSLSHEQLVRIESRVGRVYDLPAKPTRKWTRAHFLFVRFLNVLEASKRPVVSPRAKQQRLDADFDAGRRRERIVAVDIAIIRGRIENDYPELFTERGPRGRGAGSVDPDKSAEYKAIRDEMIAQDIAHAHRLRGVYADDADRYEKQIREAQERAGCKLRPDELVARDAEKQQQPERAAEVRRLARRPPTPHKRPPKIR